MTTAAHSPHDILGVRKNAGRKAIDRAYRRLVMQYHPDRNIGDENAVAKFQEIQEAYDELTGRSHKPDNRDAKAFGILSNVFRAVFKQLLEQGNDPRTVDVVGLMRHGLNLEIGNANTNIRHLQKMRDGLQALHGRFSGQQAESIEGMVQFNEQEVLVLLATEQGKIENLQRAAELLRDCRFRADAPKREQGSSSIFGMPVVMRWNI